VIAPMPPAMTFKGATLPVTLVRPASTANPAVRPKNCPAKSLTP
jgi:hypothetical protein